MITPEQMTTERWVNLLKTAGVTDLSTFKIADASGPIVIPSGEEFVGFLSEEHWKHLNEIWDEVESEFNARGGAVR